MVIKSHQRRRTKMITKKQEANIKALIKDHQKGLISDNAAMIALNVIVNGSAKLTESDRQWVENIIANFEKKEN
jgi:tRNA A37 threonylcarbamoyltransferase TsaD